MGEDLNDGLWPTEGENSNEPAVAASQLWCGSLRLLRYESTAGLPSRSLRSKRRLAETEGFEPSIGLYNPITV